MNKFAIQGHNTRGREVIQLLESLGGKNTNNLKGSAQFDYYWINSEDNSINMNTLTYIRNYDIVDFYTLEEFEELEKSCDIVIDLVNNQPQKLTDINTSGCHIIIENDKTQITQCDKEDVQIEYVKESKDKTRIIIPEDYKLKIDGDNAYLVKKLTYPNNFDECCATLGYDIGREISFDTQTCKTDTLFENFYKLYICRNAYWKVYGDIHNLDKPWEPDWTQQTTKYCIWNCKNKVDRFESTFANFMLTFPTSELRDTFLENFRDLIESCKELI